MIRTQDLFKSLLVVSLFIFPFVLSHDSLADARDADPQAQRVPVKDANKKENVKDENKKDKENDKTQSLAQPQTLSAVETVKTANPDADEQTQALLQYFTDLKNKDEHKVVSGQFAGHAATPGSDYLQQGYQELVLNVEQETGQKIGMVGIDYGQLAGNDPAIDFSLTNQPAIDAWNKGSLVTVSWHARNPWTGGNSRDLTIDGKFSDLFKEGTDANKAWMEDLGQIAAGLAELQAAGVTVLWRPLHESTSNAFWWSKGSQKEFKQLWQQMFKYFTEEKKLNNLLWVYSVAPQISSASGRRAEDYFYPGSNYVDMTGLDYYGPDLKQTVAGYKKLLKLGKPFGLTEFGPYKGDEPDAPFFDYKNLIDQIRTYIPSTVLFQTWNHGHSMAQQLDAAGLLSDVWITDARDFSR